MTLAEWQDELLDLFTTSAGTATSGIATTPGFRLTLQVQREWRAFRIRSSLPLTCRLLGESLDAEMQHYLNAVAEPSSFFLREAEQFVAHCRGRRAGSDPHVVAVARFELAMLRAVQERARPRSDGLADRPSAGDVIGVQRAADVIAFAAPPELVLMAAATGAPPPAPTGSHLLLCTPTRCRLATSDEAKAFDLARDVPRSASMLASDVLRSLGDAGALVVLARPDDLICG